MGLNTTKKVAMVNGFMQLQGLPNNISIGDYTKKNVSSDTPPDPSANTFRMEPGRCLRQRIYGVSKAHVMTPIDVKPTCVKRKHTDVKQMFLAVQGKVVPVSWIPPQCRTGKNVSHAVTAY